MQPPSFTFDPQAHIYRLDGVQIPSVTGIIKDAGLCRDYSGFQEAQWRGLHVHNACEFYDLEDLNWNSVYPQWLGYVKAWARFRDDTGFKPELIEFQTYHKEFRYAGTIDRIGVLDGKRFLIDLKTGEPEAWHGIQTAAYSMLEKVDGRGDVYLLEDGSYKLERHEDNADFRVFLAALTVVSWRKK